MRTAAHVTFLTSPSIYPYLFITIDIVTYIEDITSSVNVNLRQWTDIVTYIEDMTSPVNVPSSMDKFGLSDMLFDVQRERQKLCLVPLLLVMQ